MIIEGIEAYEYVIAVGGHSIRILGPKYPHDSQLRTIPDGNLPAEGVTPHWALPWPAAVMLAERVMQDVTPGPETILELGAGLGISGLALTAAGYRVVISDYAPISLKFIEASARHNSLHPLGVQLLDWRKPPTETYATIIASDCIYQAVDHAPISSLLACCLASGGQAFFSDMNRLAADAFPPVLERAGFECRAVPAVSPAIPGFGSRDGRIMKGRVFCIRRGG